MQNYFSFFSSHCSFWNYRIINQKLSLVNEKKIKLTSNQINYCHNYQILLEIIIKHAFSDQICQCIHQQVKEI